MERETLVTLLLMIFGGCAVQLLAAWPGVSPGARDTDALESACWFRVCLPAVPILFIAAWLVGWALVEPDPVTDPLDAGVVVVLWLPFGVLFARALARGVWALLREPPECGVSTVGLLAPQLVFSPFLAKELEEPVIRAAVAHERAHGRHRDPLRIWLAQLITDLQWPWPRAQRRLEEWLDALEWARDDEARRRGIDGADLATAVLASLRYLRALAPRRWITWSGSQFAHARLVGDGETLQRRVARLLAPLPAQRPAGSRRRWRGRVVTALWVAALLGAMALGIVYGPHVMRALLGLTS